MRKLLKKYMAVLLSGLCLMTTATGCGESGLKQKYTEDEAGKTEVMKVGNETVTLDEVYLYVIQCAYTYGLDPETAKESESSYKSLILQQIQEAKAKYQVAQTADLEITAEEQEEIETTVDKYYETFGEEIFQAYGISRDAVRQLFVEQRYITKLHDKSVSDLYEDYRKEADENYGDKTFIDADYIFFPKTKTDEDGNSVALSDAEIAKAKANAEDARDRALAGESFEDMKDSYGEDSGVIVDKQRTCIGLYAADLNELLSALQNDQVSDVYEDDAGFMVLKMNNNNDTEYRDYFLESYANQKAQDAYESMEDVWISAMDIKDEDIIGDTWEKLSLEDIAEYLYDKGLSINSSSTEE